MRNRIFAILAVVALLISVIPGSVFAFDCTHENHTVLFNNPATCNADGGIFRRCNDCGHTWLETLPATGEHTFVNGTCTNCGWWGCSEHNWVTVQETPATCIEYGYIAQECTNCGVQQNWSPEPTNTHIVENGVCIHCGMAQAEFTCEHTNNTIQGQEAATCTMEGWILYQCNDCRQTWTETLAVVAHTWNGNTCSVCGAVCEHNYELVQNIAPTCDEYGYIAYACSICGNETNTSPDPLGHTWVAHEAVAPSCNAEGNIAYEQCSVCGAAQTAGENPMPLSMYGWVLGPTGEHTFEHHDAVEATCDTDGHYAFDYCTTCECFFYEDALMLTYQAGVIPALGHTWVDYAEVAPTCDTEGNIAYQQCSVCGAARTAGENPIPLGLYGWVLGATGHTWVAHEAVAPSCNAEGNIAYEQCSVCGAAQTVGENPMPLSMYGWVLGPTGEHTFEHYDAVAATCDTDGHYAFDYCTTCECFFYEDPMLLTYQAGVIPALGHTWVAHEAVAPTCFEPGNIAYEQCSVCGAAQTAGENPIPLSMYGWVLGVTHNIAHVEAVAPTYEANGNVEYWYCTECGYAWTDANLTQVTNLLSVILPALETPATGDETPVVALIALTAMAVCGLALVMANKKRFIA